MHSTLSLIKKHQTALLLSIIVGLIYFSPDFFFIKSEDYKGLPMMYTDAEPFYIARLNSAYGNCVLNCNPFIKEYQYKYPFQDYSLSELILSIPGKITGVSVLYLKIVYNCILPALLFLLVYYLFFRLTANTVWSILCSSFIVLGHNLLNSVDFINLIELRDLFKLETYHNMFLTFSRPINPQFSSIFFLIYLHTLLTTFIRKTKTSYVVLSILYGLTFYIYFFTYAFITVLQLTIILLNILRKDYKTTICYVFVTISGLIIALPQLLNIYELLKHPYYNTIPNGYLLLTHIPDISLYGVILFILFIIFSFVIYRRENKVTIEMFFINSLVFSCFLTRNEHIISGKIMQYSHFENYIFAPIFTLTIFYYIFSLSSKKFIKKYHYYFLLLIFLPIFNSIFIQFYSYSWWYGRAVDDQKYVQVLYFLKNKTKSGSVISTPNDTLSSLVPIFTHDYVLWSYLAYQYMSIPGRQSDGLYSRTSQKALLEIGKKYDVDYYVEEKSRDLLKNTQLEKLYEDENFIVYKSEQAK